MRMGASESVAENMNAFVESVNAGDVFVSDRNEESTTQATIEDFTRTFSYVYNT